MIYFLVFIFFTFFFFLFEKRDPRVPFLWRVTAQV